MEWINAELLPEHIVVRSLEEDIFDGLILHHLFRKWLLPKLGSPGGLGGPDSPWASLGPAQCPRQTGCRTAPRATASGALATEQVQLILRTTLSCDYARFTDQETELWEAWYLVQGLTVKKVGEPGVSALTTEPPCPTGMRSTLMYGRLGGGAQGWST